MGGILCKWAYGGDWKVQEFAKCCLVKGGLLPCPPKGEGHFTNVKNVT